VAIVSPGLASKPVASGFLFGPQNQQRRVGELGLKIIVLVSWFGLKTKQATVCWHASKSSGLLYMEASGARFFQPGLKTGGGAMVGGACGTIAEVV
jgi:hypothetical protein